MPSKPPANSVPPIEPTPPVAPPVPVIPPQPPLGATPPPPPPPAPRVDPYASTGQYAATQPYGTPAPYGYAPAPGQPYQGQPYQGQPYPGQPYYQQGQYNVLAIVGFVLAFVVSLGAVICGHIALSQIKRTGERGHGLALAAVILGYAGIGFFVLYIIGAVILAITLPATSSY